MKTSTYDIIAHGIDSSVSLSMLQNPFNKGGYYTIADMDGIWKYDSYNKDYEAVTFQNVETKEYTTLFLF